MRNEAVAQSGLEPVVEVQDNMQSMLKPIGVAQVY